jgi:hypothetical protein
LNTIFFNFLSYNKEKNIFLQKHFYKILNNFIMKIILLSLILLSALFVAGMGQSIYYVSPNGNDSSDGTSWETAKQTVQAALEVSTVNNGDQIWVSQGEYILTSQIEMKEGVNVYGGFAGIEIRLEDRPELICGETTDEQASILNANASASICIVFLTNLLPLSPKLLGMVLC